MNRLPRRLLLLLALFLFTAGMVQAQGVAACPDGDPMAVGEATQQALAEASCAADGNCLQCQAAVFPVVHEAPSTTVGRYQPSPLTCGVPLDSSERHFRPPAIAS